MALHPCQWLHHGTPNGALSERRQRATGMESATCKLAPILFDFPRRRELADSARAVTPSESEMRRACGTPGVYTVRVTVGRLGLQVCLRPRAVKFELSYPTQW